MKSLTIKEKTGFRTTLPFEIFDSKGRLFYSSEFTNSLKNKGVVNFNLPKGNYSYNGLFIKLPKPVEFKKIILPKPERNLDVGKYKIIYGENPSKCTIYYASNTILFDNSFKDSPKFIKIYIFEHELGHHLYKTEKYADLYAASEMLKLGFNPSQIGKTQLEILSDRQMERKEFIIDKLTNNNYDYED